MARRYRKRSKRKQEESLGELLATATAIITLFVTKGNLVATLIMMLIVGVGVPLIIKVYKQNKKKERYLTSGMESMAHFGAVATFRLVDIQRTYNEKSSEKIFLSFPIFLLIFHSLSAIIINIKGAYRIDGSPLYTKNSRKFGRLGGYFFMFFTNSVRARINITLNTM